MRWHWRGWNSEQGVGNADMSVVDDRRTSIERSKARSKRGRVEKQWTEQS